MRKIGIISVFVTMWLLASGLARAGEVVVVAHPDFPLDHLSAAEVKKIYLGEKKFVGDVKVQPVQLARSEGVTEGFLQETIGLTVSGFESYWIKEVFKGGRVPPRKVQDAAQMLDTVARERGAIGYVAAESLAGADGVKRLLTVQVP